MKILTKIFGSSKRVAWPFLSPENESTVTVGKIVNGEKAILLVQHDEDGWQFLTGEPFDTSDAMLVGLGEIVKLDPSVLELADLPVGWGARRLTAEDSWFREKEDLLA